MIQILSELDWLSFASFFYIKESWLCFHPVTQQEILGKRINTYKNFIYIYIRNLYVWFYGEKSSLYLESYKNKLRELGHNIASDEEEADDHDLL